MHTDFIFSFGIFTMPKDFEIIEVDLPQEEEEGESALIHLDDKATKKKPKRQMTDAAREKALKNLEKAREAKARNKAAKEKGLKAPTKERKLDKKGELKLSKKLSKKWAEAMSEEESTSGSDESEEEEVRPKRKAVSEKPKRSRDRASQTKLKKLEDKLDKIMTHMAKPRKVVEKKKTSVPAQQMVPQIVEQVKPTIYKDSKRALTTLINLFD